MSETLKEQLVELAMWQGQAAMDYETQSYRPTNHYIKLFKTTEKLLTKAAAVLAFNMGQRLRREDVPEEAPYDTFNAEAWMRRALAAESKLTAQEARAERAVEIVERLAQLDPPWEWVGGEMNQHEVCFFCVVDRKAIEHPNGLDHRPDCLWQLARRWREDTV